MVYDLGGGTFDVSIIEIGDGVIEVLATSGDNHLGGDDFDERVASYLLDAFQREHGEDLRRNPMAVQRVREAAERLKAENGLTLIDPVMGDNGEVYSSYTPEMCTRMRELCAIADLITPNTTEAAILLGRDPASAPQSEREAEEWMRALYEEYGASVVLTGLDYEPGRVGSGCLENGELTISLHERIDCYYPGTGDVFAAVMLGALLGGAKLRDACVKAGEFVRDTIAYTAQQGTDPNFGVQFEKLLPYLWQK